MDRGKNVYNVQRKLTASFASLSAFSSQKIGFRCCCGLNYVPLKFLSQSLPPEPRNVAVVAERAFKERIRFKMRSLGWHQIQPDWCPYDKRKFRLASWHQDRDAERKDPVRTRGGGGSLQTRERGLRRSHSCRHLDLGLSASSTVQRTCLSCKPPSVAEFVTAAHVDEYSYHWGTSASPDKEVKNSGCYWASIL